MLTDFNVANTIQENVVALDVTMDNRSAVQML
jgi:hypothetical protein